MSFQLLGASNCISRALPLKIPGGRPNPPNANAQTKVIGKEPGQRGWNWGHNLGLLRQLLYQNVHASPFTAARAQPGDGGAGVCKLVSASGWHPGHRKSLQESGKAWSVGAETTPIASVNPQACSSLTTMPLEKSGQDLKTKTQKKGRLAKRKSTSPVARMRGGKDL